MRIRKQTIGDLRVTAVREKRLRTAIVAALDWLNVQAPGRAHAVLTAALNPEARHEYEERKPF